MWSFFASLIVYCFVRTMIMGQSVIRGTVVLNFKPKNFYSDHYSIHSMIFWNIIP